jgi:hypothetical protein
MAVVLNPRLEEITLIHEREQKGHLIAALTDGSFDEEVRSLRETGRE